MTATETSVSEETLWWSLSPEEAAGRLQVDAGQGLSADEVVRRLAQYGPNEVAKEPPPSTWSMAKEQLTNPMNVMLAIVAVVSYSIDQVLTGVIVTLLVAFNVLMGTSQEMKARASVDALSQLQVSHARVRRDGTVQEIAASEVVPGDVVLVEAGDLVPADGRLLTSATLETQEAALTGESAPVAKDRGTLPAGESALGDRTNMVFQNTQVTRGSASFVVTATGQSTQMGHIADMVLATQRVRSPLQLELDGLTKVFGLLAAIAVGDHRGLRRDPRPGFRDVGVVVCVDGDFGDPDWFADVCADDFVVGGAAVGGVQGGGQDAH